MTHPFHPLAGRQLVCVGERYNRYGTRLLLRIDEDRVFSVPRQWTDVVAPDAEVVIGEGRSLLRVADLLELADLVSRLVGQDGQAGMRKANDAAYVKETVPQASQGSQRLTAVNGTLAKERRTIKLDKGHSSGVVKITPESEAMCQGGETAQTRRPQPSSRRAR